MKAHLGCPLFCESLLHVTLLVLMVLTVSGQRDNGAGKECRMWDEIVKQLDRTVPPLTITCSTNGPCTGVECQAAIQMANLTTMRFGLQFLSCNSSSPVKIRVDVYTSGTPYIQEIDVPGTPSTYNISIPLSALQIKDYVELSGYLLLYLGPLTSTNHITLELNVSISGRLGASVYNEMRVLIPRTNVTVGRCEGGRLDTPFTPYPTSKTTPYSSSDLHDCFDHKSTGKPCSINVMYSCGNHELCAGSPPLCQCFKEFYWDGQMCRNVSEGCYRQSSANNNGLIVALTCLGVALLIGTLIAVLRYRFVRRRQRYAAHELLTNQDPDDQQLSDDPDPPMIEA